MSSGRSEYIRAHGTDHPEGCLHEERWGALDKQLSRIETGIGKLNVRLIEGNGTPSVIMRLDRCERVIATLIWIAATAGGACIVAVVGVVVAIIKEVA